MKTSLKVALVTLTVAVPAFALGAGSPPGEAMWRSVWPWDTETHTEPTAAQIPFFMGIGAFEAIGLGLAVAFLVFGRGAVRRLAPSGWRANVLHFGAAWLLGNWWAHDSLHMVNGEDLTGLLVLEYLFHATLITTGALVCWALATLDRAPRPRAVQSSAKAAQA